MSSPATLAAAAESAARAFDAAVAAGDRAALARALAPRAVVHADGVSLRRDMVGAGAVVAYFGRFFERFTYTHHVLCGATTVLSATRAAAFAFYRDAAVQPTTPRAGVPPGGDTVYGASAYELEAGPDGRVLVTDIFLTRQLADEEAVRKLGGRPHADYGPLLARLPLRDAREGSAPAHSAGRAARHAAAADAYNSAWSTGDAHPVLALLAPTFTSFSMLTGRVATGRGALADAVAALHARWQPHWHDAIVAPTPGNKAFTLWRAAGLATVDAGDGRPPVQTWATTWGLSLLLFDEAGAITAALAFAPPLPGGRAALAARAQEGGAKAE